MVDKSHLSDNSPVLEEQSIWYASNYIKKYWDTIKLQILIYLNCLYAIHFQSASTFALEKCDQPTKNLDVLSVRSSSLHWLWLTSVWWQNQDRVCLPQKRPFKPAEEGSLQPAVHCCMEPFPTSPCTYWSQWGFYRWFCESRLQPSISLSVCFQSPFCSTSSWSRTQFNKFRPGRLQNNYSCNKQLMITG